MTEAALERARQIVTAHVCPPGAPESHYATEEHMRAMEAEADLALADEWED